MTAKLDKPRQVSVQTKLPSRRASSFTLALAIFAFVNVVGHMVEVAYTQTVINPAFKNSKLRRAARRAFAHPLLPRYNMLDSGLAEFYSLAQAPDCVVLGSSLMYDPFYAMDRLRLKETEEYHYCLTLEDRMREQGLRYSPVMNLAVSGALLSDLEQITSHVFTGEHRPKWIVIGLSPGSLVGSKEVTTPSFKRLARPDEYFKYIMWYRSSFDDFFQLALSRLSPFHFYRRYWQQKIQQDSSELLKSLIGDGRPLWSNAQAETMQQSLSLMSGASAAPPPLKQAQPVAPPPPPFKQVSPPAPLSPPPLKQASPPPPPPWKQALDQSLSGATGAGLSNMDSFNVAHLYFTYTLLFKTSLSSRTLDSQLSALERLLELSRQRGMHVLLIDMPMTAPFSDLLPAGFGALYESRLDRLSDQHGATILKGRDLGFSDDDFADGVHLNASGGEKLVSKIVQVLASQESVAQSPRK